MTPDQIRARPLDEMSIEDLREARRVLKAVTFAERYSLTTEISADMQRFMQISIELKRRLTDQARRERNVSLRSALAGNILAASTDQRGDNSK